MKNGSSAGADDAASAITKPAEAPTARPAARHPSRPAANPIANPVAVLREEFDDWAVLYNPDTAEAVGIDPVGVVIWKLLDGRHTLTDVVAEVQARFDDVPDSVATEVGDFVSELARRGLVGIEWAPENR